MAKDMEWPPEVLRAIKSGIVPKRRDWRSIAEDHPDELWRLSDGEQCCYWMENLLHIPEGPLVGQPVFLLPFQEAFILALFDAPGGRASTAYFSVGRKAAKTALAGFLELFLMFGKIIRKDGSKEPQIPSNSRVNSAALTKEQSGLLWNYMNKTLMLSPAFDGLFKSVPSTKSITNLKDNIEYKSLAFENAGTLMGLSPAAFVGDEWGAVTGPTHPGIDALLSASGAYASALKVIISTISPNDNSWLSVQIDDATRNPSDQVVCHYYFADPELELDDPLAWKQACPALGVFRSERDVAEQAAVAKRLATAGPSFENLILNRRVSLNSLLISAQLFKENNKPVDGSIFRDGRPVSAGIDLGSVGDLSSVALCARDDDGDYHFKFYSFTPLDTAQDRERRDKVPFTAWINNGSIIGVPGRVTDYDYLAQWMKNKLDEEGIEVTRIAYDRWRISQLQSASSRTGFAQNAEWSETGTGFKDQSPRIETLLKAFLDGKIHHGGDPVFTMGCATAEVVKDASNNSKIDKGRYHGPKIDALAAAIMAIGEFMVEGEEFDVMAMIG